jgi:hypothetical protein
MRFEPKADLEPVTLPCGLVVQAEVKSRKVLPKLITDALSQARRYEPGAIPMAIVNEMGGEAIACLPLKAFIAIAGIEIQGVSP